MDLQICLLELVNFKLAEGCPQLFVSKLISYLMILLSCTLKIGQIKDMYAKKNVKGLSYINVLMDVMVTYVGVMYSSYKGYPFSSYGEVVIVMAQNVVILVLYWTYSGQGKALIAFKFVPVIIATYFLQTSGLPNQYFEIANTFNLIPFVIGRGDQILTSYKAQSTGSLTAFTFFLNALGSGMRIVTNMLEIGDIFLLINNCFGVALNLAVMAQIVYYSKKEKKD